MAPQTKDLQYKDAMAQLQGIVRRVESSEVDVDELAAAIRSANELITVCRAKLRSAEDEVAKALDDMRQGGVVDVEEDEMTEQVS
jgi:exodeoxyribonuclease VII small subunit